MKLAGAVADSGASVAGAAALARVLCVLRGAGNGVMSAAWLCRLRAIQKPLHVYKEDESVLCVWVRLLLHLVCAPAGRGVHPTEALGTPWKQQTDEGRWMAAFSLTLFYFNTY